MYVVESNQNAAGRNQLVAGSPVCGVLEESGRGSAHITDVSPLNVDNQKFARNAYNCDGKFLLTLPCPWKTPSTVHERDTQYN